MCVCVCVCVCVCMRVCVSMLGVCVYVCVCVRGACACVHANVYACTYVIMHTAILRNSLQTHILNTLSRFSFGIEFTSANWTLLRLLHFVYAHFEKWFRTSRTCDVPTHVKREEGRTGNHYLGLRQTGVLNEYASTERPKHNRLLHRGDMFIQSNNKQTS